jgi:hypothetical protein
LFEKDHVVRGIILKLFEKDQVVREIIDVFENELVNTRIIIGLRRIIISLTWWDSDRSRLLIKRGYLRPQRSWSCQAIASNHDQL